MIIIETVQKTLQEERGRLAMIIMTSAGTEIAKSAESALAALQWVEYGGDSPSLKILKSIAKNNEADA
jgi:hypothetical protein